ncbi:GHKL domain-containing protein [Ruminococcus sp. OA3]|uniref:sensor histidine kinase n=1 Tax=Ruminococcus sp. OA3 TaxID=2914164 RepID=UPI001F0710BF|nr:sensor histidine kinase [Ruminococcus sp. OA3]MCH1981072.1 GHKL domain-containing protein [Ruminococcus sp. OA3]
METIEAVARLVHFMLMLGTAAVFMRMTGAFVEIRNYLWLKILIALSLIPVSSIVIFYGDIVNITYAGIWYLIVVLTGFRGRLIKKLSAVLILYPLVVAVNFLVPYAVIIEYSTYPSAGWYAEICVNALMCLLVWLGIYKIFYEKIRMAGNYLTERIWAMLDAVSLMPLFVTGYVIIITSEAEEAFSIGIAVISLISNLGILYLITYMIDNTKVLLENENLHQEQEYYRELEHNQKEIRRLRHDMNNHLAAVDALLERNETEKARAYFAELSAVAAGTNRMFCKNSLINAVLGSKYQKAEELGIDTFFNIDLGEEVSMDEVDVCSLFANTLDNAIEACIQINDSQERRMELRARTGGGYFSFQLENPYVNEIRFCHGEYRTTKSDRRQHGLGIGKVRDIVGKYGGNLKISHAGGVFSVVAIIPQEKA